MRDIVRVARGEACGSVRVPTSKSIAHRALICAALCAEGERSVISGVPHNEDIDATLDCLSALGVSLSVEDDRADPESRRVTLYGRGGCWAESGGALGCRESGSTLRFMLPLCLLSPAGRTLTGSQRLLERPLDEYRAMFCSRSWDQQTNVLTVGAGEVARGGIYRLTGKTSSQFVTGLLLALPLLDGNSEILLEQPPESRSYIDMTLAVLARFGVRAAWTSDRSIAVAGNERYTATDMTVDGDASGEAFFHALGALGGKVSIANASRGDIWQGDMVCRELLDRICCCASGATVDLADCPDLGPILFTAAVARSSRTDFGGVLFTHTARLRLKESDRVSAMVDELSKFGAHMITSEDGTSADAPTALARLLDGADVSGGWVAVLPTDALCAPTGLLHGHNDHRVVMSLAVLCSLVGTGEIDDAHAVRKSFPRFFEQLRALGIAVSGDL